MCWNTQDVRLYCVKIKENDQMGMKFTMDETVKQIKGVGLYRFYGTLFLLCTCMTTITFTEELILKL